MPLLFRAQSLARVVGAGHRGRFTDGIGTFLGVPADGAVMRCMCAGRGLLSRPVSRLQLHREQAAGSPRTQSMHRLLLFP